VTGGAVPFFNLGATPTLTNTVAAAR
jgi:hypothetical protein